MLSLINQLLVYLYCLVVLVWFLFDSQLIKLIALVFFSSIDAQGLVFE